MLKDLIIIGGMTMAAAIVSPWFVLVMLVLFIVATWPE